jgi:hypothetical protein
VLRVRLRQGSCAEAYGLLRLPREEGVRHREDSCAERHGRRRRRDLR